MVKVKKSYKFNLKFYIRLDEDLFFAMSLSILKQVLKAILLRDSIYWMTLALFKIILVNSHREELPT